MIVGSDFIECVQTVCEAYIEIGNMQYRATTEYVMREISRIRQEAQQVIQPDNAQ